MPDKAWKNDVSSYSYERLGEHCCKLVSDLIVVDCEFSVGENIIACSYVGRIGSRMIWIIICDTLEVHLLFFSC